MNLIDTPAENAIEEAFVKCRDGYISVDEIINLLMINKLYFPSVKKCSEDGIDLIPLIFDRNGVSMASVFTSQNKMNYYSNYIEEAYLIPFKEILAKGSDEYGLVINPGYTIGLEIQAYGLKNIRKIFLKL
ncbi:MAG: hypothetical protein WC627_06145 [Legionella sp.]